MVFYRCVNAGWFLKTLTEPIGFMSDSLTLSHRQNPKRKFNSIIIGMEWTGTLSISESKILKSACAVSQSVKSVSFHFSDWLYLVREITLNRLHGCTCWSESSLSAHAQCQSWFLRLLKVRTFLIKHRNRNKIKKSRCACWLSRDTSGNLGYLLICWKQSICV